MSAPYLTVRYAQIARAERQKLAEANQLKAERRLREKQGVESGDHTNGEGATMIFDRLSTLFGFFGIGPAKQAAAADAARRWQAAFIRDPELACDVIRQSGLLAGQPVQMAGGARQVAPLDPYRLAYEAGRRDLGLLLLAQGGIGVDELNQLMEDQDVQI